MARPWKPHEFDSLYENFICRGGLAENQRRAASYHRRYRSRYKECVRRFAALATTEPLDVLDVGTGQMALLCRKLWGDHSVVSDLPGKHFSYMAEQGVEPVEWNLCKTEAPFGADFDFVFFSEVIEHLPIPGYIVLERLRKVLRPGGGHDLHYAESLPPAERSVYCSGPAHLRPLPIPRRRGQLEPRA